MRASLASCTKDVNTNNKECPACALVSISRWALCCKMSRIICPVLQSFVTAPPPFFSGGISFPRFLADRLCSTLLAPVDSEDCVLPTISTQHRPNPNRITTPLHRTKLVFVSSLPLRQRKQGATTPQNRPSCLANSLLPQRRSSPLSSPFHLHHSHLSCPSHPPRRLLSSSQSPAQPAQHTSKQVQTYSHLHRSPCTGSGNATNATASTSSA